jgi:hypothetical protein
VERGGFRDYETEGEGARYRGHVTMGSDNLGLARDCLLGGIMIV